MGLYKKLRKYITGRRMAWPPEYREGAALEEINLRDPFIVRYDGGYLLTGTKDFSAALKTLASFCPHPVITGANDKDGYFLYYYDQGEKRIPLKKIDGNFHGAGDVFASAFCGCIANGIALEDALRVTSDFCYRSIARSEREVKDRKYGLNYEKELLPFLEDLSVLLKK